MRRSIVLLSSLGMASCLQVLGLDNYHDGPATGGATSSTTGSGTTASAGGMTTSGTAGMTSSTSGMASSSTGMKPPSYTAVAVTGGEKHTCALLMDGQIVCWGNNDSGQLGNGTFKSSPTPVLVSNITTATAVSAGGRHTCALLMSGEVRCWGEDFSNQLGIGVSSNQSKPVPPTGLPGGIGGVSAGDNHTCAFAAGGKAYCWGSDLAGQLGRNSIVGGTGGVQAVDTLSIVQSIAAGGSHTCAADNTATIWCWGDNSHMQVAKSGAS